MKRILPLLLMLVAVAASAQKQQKPNINKALSAWKEGKLNEAKDIIDAASTYEKTMDDGKTWYYRGLIYASLDTTSNPQFKSLDPNPLKVAMESFAKAKQMGKAGNEYFVQGATPVDVQTQSVQLENLANYYLDKGIKAFQDENDYTGSLALMRKTKTVAAGMNGYRNDTLTYYVTAIVAQQADSLDLALEDSRKYIDKGGKSKDIYTIMYQIYLNGPKEDKNKALEVVREGRKKIPNNPDFPKMEIGLLIDMHRTNEAKDELERAIKAEPGNKILHFYLGYINSQLAQLEVKKLDSLYSAKAGEAAINERKDLSNQYTVAARKSFEDALKIDPNYFEAQFYLANTYLVDVDKTSKELSNTGNKPADSKKRSELVQRRVKESEIALPYLEKAEKMKAPDKDSEVEVLHKLSLLYYYVADDKNTARVQKKLKDMGEE